MNSLDFDAPVERRHTGSYKWDSAASDDIIPLWVADMDFQTAPCVIEALQRRVSHGVFGYTLVTDDYYYSLVNWFDSRHGYRIDPARVIYTSGVVPAISAIIKALVKPGEGVIVQTPVYNCFFSSIRNNGAVQVDAPLIRRNLEDCRFTYEMDFDALERAASRDDVKLMLLCNPHNPAGRCWRRDELQRVADICSAHGVMVVSDEIHCELTMPGYEYHPYGVIDKSAIVCLSPSKAFNTAGLQIANIVCPDQPTQELVDRAINVNEVCDVNPFGVVALQASYSPAGMRWLDALRSYLYDNYLFFCDYLKKELPDCPVSLLEATYLPWVDVSRFGVSASSLEHEIKEQARVWVNSGEMYGKDGFVRFNIATQRTVLAEGLRRFCQFMKHHSTN